MKKYTRNRTTLNKERFTIKSWRIGEYLRQLSIVILGIVVTFVGSNLISGYSKSKEVASVMRLVKAELQNNQRKLEHVQQLTDHYLRLCNILIAEDFDYKKVPHDTLVKYKYTTSRFTFFDYSENSLEVLKNSSLMQHVEDKDFLISLTQTYESMRGLSGAVSSFYERKIEAWNSFAKDVADEDTRAMRSDTESFYRIMLSSQAIRTHMSHIYGFFDPDAFNNLHNKLSATILSIEQKYE